MPRSAVARHPKAFEDSSCISDHRLGDDVISCGAVDVGINTNTILSPFLHQVDSGKFGDSCEFGDSGGSCDSGECGESG